MKKDKRKKKAGFTLIELIIVIAILGIIASIAVPKYGSIQKDAKIRADQVSAQVLANTTSMLIAKGDINMSQNLIKLDSSEDDAEDIKGYLQKIPKIEAKSDYGFYIEVKNDGSILVYTSPKDAKGVGDMEFQLYPELDAKYPDGTK